MILNNFFKAKPRKTKVGIFLLFLIALLVGIGLSISKFTISVGSVSVGTTLATKTPQLPPKEASMLFAGDVMLSRSVGALMAEKNNYKWPFELISDFLSNADFAFVNLETPISNRGIKVGSIYSFRSDPRVIEGLTYAGVDLVSVANNHAWDYGREAFVDTLDYLSVASISYVGGGRSYEEAHAGVIKTIGNTEVGFLAYTNLLPKSLSATKDGAGVAIYDKAQMVQDVTALKAVSDIVVVSFHWGEEYQQTHNALQEQIAHDSIDAGADLIIGHHPHVVQDVGEYKGRFIVYSLGNFVFDQNFSTETMSGLVVRVRLKDNQISGLDKIPVHISKQYQPSL